MSFFVLCQGEEKQQQVKHIQSYTLTDQIVYPYIGPLSDYRQNAVRA